MGIGSLVPSIHKRGDWQGQYHRMIRWYNKFNATHPGEFESHDINDQHDILYACFQNIFFLKDWLLHTTSLPNATINTYVNQHLELQLCRDICNGTKHFELTNASIEADFTIIREYNPFHKTSGKDRYKIIILSGGHKFELKALAATSIKLWEDFIIQNNLVP